MDSGPAILNVNASKRYYCHSCRTEVRVTASFTCVQCCGGFVEEIMAGSTADIPRLLRLLRHQNESSANLTNNNTNNAIISDSDESFASTSSAANANASAIDGSAVPNTEGLSCASGRPDNFRSVIMNVLMDVLDLLGSVNNSAAAESSSTTAHDAPNTSRHGVFFDNFRSRLRDMVAARHLSASNRESSNQNPLNAFFDLAFGSTGSGLSANLNFGNQTFVMGNPNNYDRQEDDLTNLLMNTLSRLLPNISRPLTNDKLQLIPKVEVTVEDLANQDMCAICWDEFQLKESVRKLPCSHFFHETCVFPWLKLHRTCPLCRNCLTDDLECGGYNLEESLSGESLEFNETTSIDMAGLSSDDSTGPEAASTVKNSSMSDNVN